MEVAAAVVPALISLIAGWWLWLCLGRYFRKFEVARGPVARAKPWFRLGLGLDDVAVGTWDLLPAWRIVTQNTGDPELEADRRRTRTALWLFLAQLPGAFLEAAALVALVRAEPATSVMVAFGSWVVISIPAQYRAIWLSRPEVRQFQLFGLRAFALLVSVVAGSLVLAGAIVVLALTLRR